MSVSHDLEVPVLIVGGGGTGLAESVFLSDLGVDSLTVERHSGTAILMKAHIIHTRTLEIFGQHGMADDFYEVSPPLDTFSAVTFNTSLGGDEPWDRRRLHSIPAWSGGAQRERYAKLTPYRMGNYPQNLLEPFLRGHAEARAGADRVRFGHEFVSLEQDEDGVTSVIRDREADETYTVRSQYVVGADGGRDVAAQVGIEILGPPPFVDMISVHIEANLGEWLEDDESTVRLFVQPQPDGTVERFGLVKAGGDRWDRYCTRWHVGVTLPIDAAREREEFDEAKAEALVRKVMKLPDLELEVLRISHWEIESVLAERYQEGRVFLAGDAAHRHSPMGGLGLNTGLQDAHSIAWMLAAVVKGEAGPQLLEAYDLERRPVGRERVDFATFAFFSHLAVNGAFMMIPGAPEEHNRGMLTALFAETREGERARRQLREYFDTLRRENQHADLDLGVVYEGSPAIVGDGTPPPERDPDGTVYVPRSRPGHRLPHAWLDRDGERISTIQLVRPGVWLLLTGEAGAEWIEAAKAAATAFGIEIDAYAIGGPDGLVDSEGAWADLRGHSDQGALLVRPDGHVAFRSEGPAEDPEAAISEALRSILARSAAVLG
jgi:2,4-dichlorophenol 6-monooxygenase